MSKFQEEVGEDMPQRIILTEMVVKPQEGGEELRVGEGGEELRAGEGGEELRAREGRSREQGREGGREKTDYQVQGGEDWAAPRYPWFLRGSHRHFHFHR